MGIERVVVVIVTLLLLVQPPQLTTCVVQADTTETREESDAPRNLTVEWTGEYAVLSWSPPDHRTDEVVGYNVTWRRGSPFYRTYVPYHIGRLGPVHIEVVNGTEWHHHEVDHGVYYTYQVRAIFPEGEGRVPSTKGCSPWLDLPSEPMNLTANRTSGQLRIKWERPSDDGGAPITEYRIFRGRFPDQLELLTVVKGHPGTDFGMRYQEPQGAIVDTGNLSSEMIREEVMTMVAYYPYPKGRYETVLSDNLTYYYRVRSATIEGEGPLSEMLVVPPNGAPEAPTGLAWELVPKGVVLTWEAPPGTNETAVLRYKVLRRSQYENWTLVGSVPGTEPTYRDIYADPFYEYEYSVSAVNDMGQGPFSEGVTLPGNLTLPPSEEDGGISWMPTILVIVAVSALVVLATAVLVRLRGHRKADR